MPTQAFAVGVIVIVAMIVEEVRFVAVKVGIFPEPEATSPIEGVLFVHA